MPARLVGLDITPTSLTAVVARRKGKLYGVVKHAIGPLEHGIVVDGEVHDVQRLGDAIRHFWEREGIGEKNVVVGVANQRVITRVIELPRIRKKQQLRDAISFEVADNLPIPIEDAVWDFHTVESYKDDNGIDRQRHVVVMAYRESAERYRDAIDAAGLKLHNIDLAGFALMRAGMRCATEGLGDGEDEAPVVALCDIGPTSTNVVIARNGICELNRIVSFGARVFSQTLTEQFGWSIEDADRVRMEAGVTAPGGVEAAGDPYADSRRVMQFVADQFVGELRTSFDYYAHSTNGANRVERVVLAGEGALLRGIESQFAAELGVPVVILDASSRLDAGSVTELGPNHAHLGTALGLAMEDAA
jgi:type IV pilus assembly protein PilM